MKKFLHIFLFPLCILAGIGLFQLIFRIFGEGISFGYQVVIGVIVGVIMWISEAKLFIAVSRKFVKYGEQVFSIPISVFSYFEQFISTKKPLIFINGFLVFQFPRVCKICRILKLVYFLKDKLVKQSTIHFLSFFHKSFKTLTIH